jgi:hypothetical protein
MTEGLFVAARSSRGSLAHTIRVKDLYVFERRRYVVAACLGAETNTIVAVPFDPDAETQGGFKTCHKCVEKYRQHHALARALREWTDRRAHARA